MIPSTPGKITYRRGVRRFPAFICLSDTSCYSPCSRVWVRKVREKLEEAMEEVERLLEELEASRSVEPPPERGVKTQRQRSSRRRISE
jgi:hypothetical protein